MVTHVALWRGVNVAGHNLVAMSDRRDLCESLGFAGANPPREESIFVLQIIDQSQSVPSISTVGEYVQTASPSVRYPES